MTATSQTASTTTAIARLVQHSEIALAVGVVIIIAVMIIPLPTLVLDMLLAVNIAVAITILLVSMYVSEPLQFSVFPSLLLIVTLFRLGLNVAAARLILLQADAGQLVEAFGQFVVGGNYVVGLVVFVILLVIQFVVITNGAGRVAEVAARFTLDAMPGKQMSIDADLNAGLITEEEARLRRRLISMEAEFYGAMDGASKFVKGDVLAAVLILIVDVIGGFGVGVLLQGFSLQEALSRYVLLTVGAGLVTQIPALLISTAMGIIVTRTASESDMSRAIVEQTVGMPRVLTMVGGLLLAFGLVPGMPSLPFLTLGVVTVLMAQWLKQPDQEAELAPAGDAPAAPAGQRPREESPEDVANLLRVDPLGLGVGYTLIPLVDREREGNLLDRIAAVRRQIAQELGFIIPRVRIRDNLHLPPQTYVIRLRGEEVARGKLMTNQYLAMGAMPADENASDGLEGISVTEPAFGLPALWVSEDDKEKAELMGYTVVDPLSVLSTHLTEVIKAHAAELLSRQDVRNMLDRLREESPALVDDLIPNLLTVGEVQRILQNLLMERVSVLDLPAILDSVAYYAKDIKDPDTLSEYARQALARSLCNRYKAEDNLLHVITLSPSLEQAMSEALQSTDQAMALNLQPGIAQRFLESLGGEAEKLAAQGHQPVVLCPARIRLPLRRLVARVMPHIIIMAYNEVVPETNVYTEGIVEID
ncbi:MAG: Flagellar biosynthesis protein FlhA [Anaerolineales bacterium]|nr:Flagellar biosynthesis protein FlhA [Anaerolineales bacterium]